MKPSRSFTQTFLTYVILGALVFAGGFAVSRFYGLRLSLRRTIGFNTHASYTPEYSSRSGSQLVMVYLGSSTCAASNDSQLPEAIETLKLRLASYAEREEMSFVSIGVGLDWIPERGIEHLFRFGRFDEVSSGYSWGNSAGLQYMWSDRSIMPVTPQVVVYQRLFSPSIDSTNQPRYEQSGLELLGAAAGVDEILQWVTQDSALPTAEPASTLSRRLSRTAVNQWRDVE
jgi:hypothetical protein